MITWSDTRVLVTGGAGFIGSHLVEQLVGRNAYVTVVDDLSNGKIENLPVISDHLQLKELDIRHIAWENIFKEQAFDVIFHLAANAYVPPSVEKPEWDYQINLDGSFRLLEQLRREKWPGVFIYASSAAVYGNPQRLPIQEGDITVPISPYGVGKLASERYIAVFAQLYGLRAASLRLFSVYGPRQRKQVVYEMIRKMIQDPTVVTIFGDGTQVRDFNYVEDTALAMIVTAEKAPLCGEVYNLASGRECTIRLLVETLVKILNIEPKLVFSGSVRPGDPDKWSVDISLLKSLGYQPQVSLEDGLCKTVEWFQRNQNK